MTGHSLQLPAPRGASALQAAHRAHVLNLFQHFTALSLPFLANDLGMTTDHTERLMLSMTRLGYVTRHQWATRAGRVVIEFRRGHRA